MDIIGVDHIIKTVNNQNNTRLYRDGTSSNFKNLRLDCCDISPFDYTLLMDVDYIIRTRSLVYLFEETFTEKLRIGQIAHLANGNKPISNYMNSLGDKFYWSTLVWFHKSKQIFFDLVKEIYSKKDLYWSYYNIPVPLWRNDYAYSMALSILGLSPPSIVDSIQCVDDSNYINKLHPLVMDDQLISSDLHFMQKRQLCNLINLHKNANNILR